MFDDFQSGTDTQSRKRLQRSLAAAFMIYGGSAAGLVAATATARHVVEEELQQVEFAATPEPEPPPPPEPPPEAPKPKTNAAPKAKRQTIKPPDEVPLDKPKESDAPLAAAGDTGPVDGFTDGVEGGTGSGKAPPPPPPPPPPKAEPLIKPVEAPSNEQPKYPKAAERKGIEGVVVVQLEILENGRIGKARIVSGPPEFHDYVLEAVKNWRYKPASRGGVPVRYTVTRSVRFRLEDA